MNDNHQNIFQLAQKGNAEAVIEIFNYLLINYGMKTPSFFRELSKLLLKEKKFLPQTNLFSEFGKLLSICHSNLSAKSRFMLKTKLRNL